MKSTKTKPAPADQSLARNTRYHRRFALLAAMQSNKVLSEYPVENPGPNWSLAATAPGGASRCAGEVRLSVRPPERQAAGR